MFRNSIKRGTLSIGICIHNLRKLMREKHINKYVYVNVRNKKITEQRNEGVAWNSYNVFPNNLHKFKWTRDIFILLRL
jgi:3-isopropylmalate dehydratase small subunit